MTKLSTKWIWPIYKWKKSFGLWGSWYSNQLDSRFQHKNQFWKICTEARDIGQNVSNFSGLVWMAEFLHFFGNFLGLRAYFSKLIFVLKPWVWAGQFEYNEPYNPKNFFSHLYRGQSHFQYGFSKGRWSRKTLKFWEVYFFIHWNDISLGQNQRSKFLQIGTPYWPSFSWT